MTAPRDGVAIIGMAGRFPGARDVAEFWANLRDGVESIVPLTDDELLAAGVPPEVFGRPDYVKAVPRFEGADLFDAEFFGCTAREAEIMDPQHRLFLETSWEALEDAGYDAAQHDGPIGVFGGAGANRYLQHVHSHRRIVDAVGQTQVLVGNELGFLATRVSYKLDLKGPSISLRTACSTALVALHTACRSLLSGECDLALSGGVHVDPARNSGYPHQEGSFVSPDGHVRPFDADARGTVFGTGVGVVVLKRLADALADGDTVRAVVRGSGINNDGAVKVGFTAPSVTGQAAAITAALADAGITAADVDYVEAHGTGTSLGDPVEVQALARAFDGAESCALGSVKGNVGHLDAASGIAGLIKTTLALEHETLPPSLNYRNPNPAIDFASGPFHVQAVRAPWPRTGGRVRRAGVSAFGFGGTNAHVVLEEAPRPTARPAERRVRTLVLSARTPEALELATDRLAAFLRREDPDLADVANTLARGRRAFPHRRIVTGHDVDTVASALEARDPARVVTGSTAHDSAPVVFAFPGQGSQHLGMARDLHEREPVFRQAFDECADLLRPVLDADLRDVVFSGTDPALLDRTDRAQPALFAVEHALTALWRSWGITPTAMIGHSLGEWVAACVAGVFSLPDALALVALRGKLMQAQNTGAMLNVIADRDAVEAALPAGLSLAAHNGPRDCVVSGPHDAVDAFAALAGERGWTTQAVATSHAFHSALMAPMVDEFAAAVAARQRHAPTIPFVSNTTGDWITDEQARDPAYWGGQILACVEFAAGVRTATATAGTTLLEVGPGQALTSLARRVTGTANAVHSLPHKKDRRGGDETAHRALGRLWTSGTTPDWAAYHGGRARRIPLPTYPFARKRFWLDKLAPAAPTTTAARRDDVADWFYAPSWQRAPLPTSAAPDHSAHWLVLADEVGVGDAVAGRLRDGGATVTVVRAADTWSEPEPGLYTVDPATGADHDRLVAALRDGPAGVPTHIVHGWSVTDVEDEDSLLRLGFASLIRLAQALARHADAAPRRIWVLSTGLQNVTGAERLSPLKATLLGPCRVLPREMPGTTCRSVDLDRSAAPTPLELDRLMTELAAEPEPGVDAVAHRGPHRWAQHHLPRRLPLPDRSSTLRERGVYLVTGGLGGLGLALAGHLAAAGARIVLTSRTALPPEPEWTGWLATTPADHPSTAAVRELVRLRDAGAEILVARADVSDPDAMRGAVAQAVARWGAVHGAFHAAGVAGGGLIQLKDLAAAADVLRPKVRGTLVLEEALAGQDLDFLVLFGSNGANVGNAGQVDYCAANCFLDAFAQDRGRSRRVVSIDWGAWKGVGMAVTTTVPSALGRARLLDVDQRGMSAAEGLRALDAVLDGTAESQVIVSPVELARLFAGAFSLAREEDSGPAHARPDLPTEYAAPRGDAEREICQVWQDLLGVEHVGAHDSFFDLGGDSLVAIQLIGSVNARLGVRLTVGDLYEGRTAAHLAGLVERPVPAAIGAKALEDRKENMRKRRQHQQQRRRTVRGQ